VLRVSVPPIRDTGTCRTPFPQVFEQPSSCFKLDWLAAPLHANVGSSSRVSNSCIGQAVLLGEKQIALQREDVASYTEEGCSARMHCSTQDVDLVQARIARSYVGQSIVYCPVLSNEVTTTDSGDARDRIRVQEKVLAHSLGKTIRNDLDLA
jgi:hypothetical protein